MKQIHKWITISEYVDIETGEVINKSMIERKAYYKVGKPEKKIEIKEVIVKNERLNYGHIKYITRCRESKQLRLL